SDLTGAGAAAEITGTKSGPRINSKSEVAASLRIGVREEHTTSPHPLQSLHLEVGCKFSGQKSTQPATTTTAECSVLMADCCFYDGLSTVSSGAERSPAPARSTWNCNCRFRESISITT